MQVTGVRVRPLAREGATKAFCTIFLDGELAIHDIRVVEGKNGLFVSMPSRRLDTGGYRDVAHPITSSMREAIQERVLEAYRESCARIARSGAAGPVGGGAAPDRGEAPGTSPSAVSGADPGEPAGGDRPEAVGSEAAAGGS
ncbi:SpoVG family protein [Caldinitratiruptor microaerophilus]|uniref:Septation protein SpoVG n=1 Tax=Caldinitratiruptor microaerophilus TaxID=671077 RepID=A0AA35CNY6_9FIRM|nr:SpoVG family protein [Caldinitratiruptor microaerophilus]BDG62008.1 hypothetical protein caldi_30980 [Caldinitratiruptor microaerophilus]